MQLGWIDFSAAERNKILSVLDLLGHGTLDELGIASIRDGFANAFFPGTSTIQTRAKYFFLVPYICKDLERSGERNPQALRKAMEAEERACGHALWLKDENEYGLIGSRSLRSGGWVKRQPSDIYWAGLKAYHIFLNPSLSASEYLRTVCALHSRRHAIRQLGNRKEQAEEYTCDDADAGNVQALRFWNIPTYDPQWKQEISMELTQPEAVFLRQQILETCSGTLLAFILENRRADLLECESFGELCAHQNEFPDQIKKDLDMAREFSEFLYIIRIVYNIMISAGQNELANEEYKRGNQSHRQIASLDLNGIFDRLNIADPHLCRFLINARQDILDGDETALKKHIRDREIFLKGESRAKTAHPGEFDPDFWAGGGRLDYRYSNAKTILLDIFKGEGSTC